MRAEYNSLLEVESKGWTDPAPLGKAVADLPEFPGDALPKWVAEKVAAVADETQTPMDLAASVALATLATACAGKARVIVRPGMWSEPVNLFLVTALPPGTRKSPVFSTMITPLLAAEKVLQDTARPQIVQAVTTRQIAEERAARAATAAAKASLADRTIAEIEAQEAAAELEAATVPTLPRLVADDITPEAAASMLADQGGRLAILSAESEIFAIMAGRYSGTPSMNVFLKGHAGDILRVDRRGRPRKPSTGPLTLGICTQPSVLRDLAEIPGAAGRGLLGRFLYALPTVNVGNRNTEPDPAEPATHAAYATQLHALALSMAERDGEAELTLSPEASAHRRDASARYEKRMADEGDLAGIRDWAGKAVGAAMRIAGLLHLAEHLCDGYDKPISGTTAANAIRIIDYYALHALAAFDAMSTDETIVRARAVLGWIHRVQPVRFTAREAFTAAYRQRFPRIGDMDAALTVLERHGYIRRLPDPPTAGRGRPPAPAYETHPSIGT
ncbi:YfjI family protein [Catenulispora yoronensis]